MLTKRFSNTSFRRVSASSSMMTSQRGFLFDIALAALTVGVVAKSYNIYYQNVLEKTKAIGDLVALKGKPNVVITLHDMPGSAKQWASSNYNFNHLPVYHTQQEGISALRNGTSGFEHIVSELNGIDGTLHIVALGKSAVPAITIADQHNGRIGSLTFIDPYIPVKDDAFFSQLRTLPPEAVDQSVKVMGFSSEFVPSSSMSSPFFRRGALTRWVASHCQPDVENQSYNVAGKLIKNYGSNVEGLKNAIGLTGSFVNGSYLSAWFHRSLANESLQTPSRLQSVLQNNPACKILVVDAPGSLAAGPVPAFALYPTNATGILMNAIESHAKRDQAELLKLDDDASGLCYLTHKKVIEAALNKVLVDTPVAERVEVHHFEDHDGSKKD